MLLHPLVLAAHQCRTRKHIHNISDVNAVQSLMLGVFCIREPYYHADLNAIALAHAPDACEKTAALSSVRFGTIHGECASVTSPDRWIYTPIMPARCAFRNFGCLVTYPCKWHRAATVSAALSSRLALAAGAGDPRAARAGAPARGTRTLAGSVCCRRPGTSTAAGLKVKNLPPKGIWGTWVCR
jgi:hypothetical protein